MATNKKKSNLAVSISADTEKNSGNKKKTQIKADSGKKRRKVIQANLITEISIKEIKGNGRLYLWGYDDDPHVQQQGKHR